MQLLHGGDAGAQLVADNPRLYLMPRRRDAQFRATLKT
jgi:hypothetical protein